MNGTEYNLGMKILAAVSLLLLSGCSRFDRIADANEHDQAIMAGREVGETGAYLFGDPEPERY